mgnify:CR=1 FL=1
MTWCLTFSDIITAFAAAPLMSAASLGENWATNSLRELLNLVSTPQPVPTQSPPNGCVAASSIASAPSFTTSVGNAPTFSACHA